jgi:hypothetical protein
MLPLDWVLRNPHAQGARDAAIMLITVYPDAVIPEPLSPGGPGLEACWSDLVRVLSRPDGRLGRYGTIASLSAPMTQLQLDGHCSADQGGYYSRLSLTVPPLFARNRRDAAAVAARNC